MLTITSKMAKIKQNTSEGLGLLSMEEKLAARASCSVRKGVSRPGQQRRKAGVRCAGASGHHAQLCERRPGSVCFENVTHETEPQGTKASVGRSLFLQFQLLTLHSRLFWKPVSFPSTGTPSPPPAESQFQ